VEVHRTYPEEGVLCFEHPLPSPRTGKRGRLKRSCRRTIEEENKIM